MEFSKVKQRAVATDLSGPKAFAESLTPRSNLAVEDAVAFEFDFSLSAAALGSTLSWGRRISGG